MTVLRSIESLEALRDEWNELAAIHGHALLRHEWFAAAARTLHDARDLAIVVERDKQGRLAAVAPLVVGRSGGLRRLELIGTGSLYEPSGFVYRDHASAERLRRAVFSMRMPVLLRAFVDSSFQAGRKVGRSGVLVSRPGGVCLGVEFDEDHFMRPSGKLKSDIRRAHHRASELGDVRAEMLSPGPQDVDRLLEDFVSVEAAGWKGRCGSALAVNPRMRAFFREYCARQAAEGTLRLSFLRIGDRPIAGQIATEQYNRQWVLKIGYDERAARCSPGFLLNAEAIRFAAAHGLKSYEFLGAAEDWERRWRPVVRPTSLLLFYPWSIRGCVGASADLAGRAWRRLSRESRELARDHSGGVQHSAPSAT